VEEHLAARLEDTVRLADLAALLDLPPREASRLIREATGLTPHALLMERRIERARDLAVCTRMPLAELAARGFASQSHMTTLMRRRLGATPGQIRAAAG
jgi:AraC family transcriptional regulator